MAADPNSFFKQQNTHAESQALQQVVAKLASAVSHAMHEVRNVENTPVSTQSGL